METEPRLDGVGAERTDEDGQVWPPAVHDVQHLEVPGIRITSNGPNLVCDSYGVRPNLWWFPIGMIIVSTIQWIMGYSVWALKTTMLTRLVSTLFPSAPFICGFIWQVIHGRRLGHYALDAATHSISTGDRKRLAIGHTANVTTSKGTLPLSRYVVHVFGLGDASPDWIAGKRTGNEFYPKWVDLGSFRNLSDADAVANVVAEFTGLPISRNYRE